MKNVVDTVLVVVLVVVTLGIAFQQLTESPPTWIDEGMYAQLAINLAEHGIYGLQIAPGEFVSGAFITLGFPVVAPLAGVFSVFGVGIEEARLYMVFWIVALVVTAFWYVRRHYGRQAAVLSGFLLVTFPPLYANGKNIMGEVPGLFFFILLLFFLERWHSARLPAWRSAYMLFGALMIGLCIVIKPIFLPLGLALLLTYGWTYLRGELVPLGWRDIGIGALGFGAPVILWLVTQFFPGDSATDVFAFYANPYGVVDVLQTTLANLLRFFTETSPMYVALITAVWGISIVIREFKQGETRPTSAERVAFVFTCLILAFYLRTPGWYKYFFVPQMLGLVFLPYAILHIEALWKNRPWFFRKLGVFVILSIVALHAYLLMFDSWISSSHDSRKSAEIESYFSEYNPQSSLLIYNAPELALFLPAGTTYYQFLEINTGIEVGRAVAATAIKTQKVDTIIARLGPHAVAEEFFPGYAFTGRLNSFFVFSKELEGDTKSQ